VISSVLQPFGTHRPPADPHALARAILSDPRFRVAVVRPKPKTWWEGLLQWFSDRWSQLIEAFAHRVHVSPNASVAIGDVLLIVLVALVVIVAARLLLGMMRDAGAPATGSHPLPLSDSGEALYARSVCAADRGDYSSAISLLFRATLAALDLRGVIHDDPSRTVNECRRTVRERAPESLPLFEIIARAFTAALYADVPLSQEQWSRARAAFERLAFAERGDAA
jgi:hypothetical protein